MTNAQRLADTIAFAPKVPDDVTAVCGVPRSGMFSASVLAEMLHLTLYSIDQDGELVCLMSGWRHVGRDGGKLLLLDDTVCSGASLRRLPVIARPHIKAAIYVTPEHLTDVDLYQVLLPNPHYLEWNLFNSIYSASLACDFDGVLCENPPRGCGEGCGYERWLQTAPIRQRPRKYPLQLIATARLRQYKRHTEIWLEQHGIARERLVTWEGDPEARWVDDAAAKMKGIAYAESPARLFVESDPLQARVIAEVSGKRVICIENTEVYG